MRGLIFWVLALSLLDFALMGADKRRARQGRRRVPERTFFLVALLGGSPGAIAGMWAFRHKTRRAAVPFSAPPVRPAPVPGPPPPCVPARGMVK